MALPDYQALMLPLLRFAAEKERPIRECAELAAEEFALTPQEREQRLPSGRQTTLYNRVHWAVTYLAQAGLIERPRRGVIVATQRGSRVLDQYHERIDNTVLSQFEEFQAFRQRSREGMAKDGVAATGGQFLSEDEETTPEEKIEIASQLMNSSLRRELLAKIVESPPLFFEQLIIDLMSAMGYGGSGSAHHLGKTHDGGVDGLINEDPLGLEVVYLQAKRYSAGNVIGVDKIREFAGSLDEKGAIKGVFVTTSHFASSARQYAERSPKRLVLIDGEELAALLVRYGVGVRTFRNIEMKKIDLDYFPSDEEQ